VGGTLVGISVDGREDSTALVARLGLHYPLLSDPDLRVASAYGVAMKGRDIAVPSVFVVRGDRIVYRKVGETVGDRPTPDEVVAQVTAAAGH
jgi:peroxiredoxin